MPDPFMQMALDAGYRGEDAESVARQIEEAEHRMMEQFEAEMEYQQWLDEEGPG
jgi:hypothetical protein